MKSEGKTEVSVNAKSTNATSDKANSKSAKSGSYSKSNRGKRRNTSKAGRTDSPRSDSKFRSTSAAISNIVNASASVAVRNIAGNTVSIKPTNFGSTVIWPTANFTIPGVYTLGYAPLFGKATGVMTDPVNLAARNMWMNLRSLYSNRIPYTAGAIVMYSMALDSILSAFQWLKRAYGILFAYDVRNRYVPDTLIRAMGIDPVDFRANIPFIRVYLNKLSTQLSAFGVPTDLRFILDHIDACAHVYMDDVSANAQYLIMTPTFLWKIDWEQNQLTPVQWFTTSGETWQNIKSALDQLVEAFVNNEDTYMIASDMMRLYGNLAMVAPVEENYVVGPEYDPDFLERMHNATYPMGVSLYSIHSNPETPATAALLVTEDQAPSNVGAIKANYCAGFTISNTFVDPSKAGLAYMMPYDFSVGDPSTEQIVSSSNMKYVVEFTGSKANFWNARIKSTGTVILDDLYSWRLDPSTKEIIFANLNAICNANTSNVIVPGAYNPQHKDHGWCELSKWKKHPLLPIYSGTASTASNVKSVTITNFDQPYGDLDQYVTLDSDELERIHEAIILDKFDAAGIGTLNLKAK